MKHLPMLALSAALALGSPAAAQAGEAMIETFENAPETRWRFFTDTVMGGVSTGDVRFLQEDGKAFARLAGSVSTENNGGFIQMRLDLPDTLPTETQGVRLVARGNGQRYFVHLRTGGTLLPWQYYQAGFEVTGDWAEYRIPLSAFRSSGPMLRPVPRATGIKSIAVVAYGRDHAARVDVREIGFY